MLYFPISLPVLFEHVIYGQCTLKAMYGSVKEIMDTGMDKEEPGSQEQPGVDNKGVPHEEVALMMTDLWLRNWLGLTSALWRSTQAFRKRGR